MAAFFHRRHAAVAAKIGGPIEIDVGGSTERRQSESERRDRESRRTKSLHWRPHFGSMKCVTDYEWFPVRNLPGKIVAGAARVWET